MHPLLQTSSIRDPLDCELIDDRTIVQLMGIDQLRYPEAIIRSSIIDAKRARLEVHRVRRRWRRRRRRRLVPTITVVVATGQPNVGNVCYSRPVTQPPVTVVQTVHVDRIAKHRKA